MLFLSPNFTEFICSHFLVQCLPDCLECPPESTLQWNRTVQPGELLEYFDHNIVDVTIMHRVYPVFAQNLLIRLDQLRLFKFRRLLRHAEDDIRIHRLSNLEMVDSVWLVISNLN